MADHQSPFGGLPPVYLSAAGTSFTDFLRVADPDLLPGRRPLPPMPVGAAPSMYGLSPHATTIVAATFAGGVIMAGDRRATAGNLIASRDMEKVFAADSHSVVGVAGSAGIGMEMVKLYQVELEHYEKINGTTLSLDGKANRLALMIRGNLSAAMQGLAVVPMFAGFDPDAADPDTGGRIFSYDVTGGLFEEHDFTGVGSGSTFAKNALKKMWQPGSDRDAVVRVLVESLFDAADDDSATGGPDFTRQLFPILYIVDAVGVTRVPDEEVGEIARIAIDGRSRR